MQNGPDGGKGGKGGRKPPPFDAAEEGRRGRAQGFAQVAAPRHQVPRGGKRGATMQRDQLRTSLPAFRVPGGGDGYRDDKDPIE